MKGTIVAISGVTVTVAIDGLKLYDRVRVGERRLVGEVVRLEPGRAIVQVYEEARGLAVGEPVESGGKPLSVQLGPGLLGTMFDGLQRPLQVLYDQAGAFIGSGYEPPALAAETRWPFTPLRQVGDQLEAGEAVGYVEEGAFRHVIPTPAAGTLERIEAGEFGVDDVIAHLDSGIDIHLAHHWPVRQQRPSRQKLAPKRPLVTGQRCLDFLFPMVKGGAAIFPGGFGTGKTVLEQSIAKYADVDIVVYVGCGERGNEMAEMLDEFVDLEDPYRGGRLLERTIVLANTSNMPVAAREASIYTAIAMAEYYRDMGYDVLLLADSISRWAEALREISSSLEEMPGEEGYPTYLGSRLSAFLERAGVVETADGRTGSLSMVLAVSPPGGDFTEPVTQCCLRVSGAFYMLDAELAHSRHFPAINWSQSYSLYERVTGPAFDAEIDENWSRLRERCRKILQQDGELREVAEIVGQEGLQDEDQLVLLVAENLRQRLLCQNAYSEDAFCPPEKTLSICRQIIDDFDAITARLEAGEALNIVLAEGDHALE
ncbi:MAG: V-type ATP synthase subunit A [Desulfuromonas sp.]|nr:MAG: V-type ATP synthase subunit A [Desulfuromonas sp.]